LQEHRVHIATIHHQGRLRVGRLTRDKQCVDVFAIDGSRGALALIGLQALPRVDCTVPLAAATLAAPIPVPRRNLFCVGRNYRAHASELQGSVFKDNAKAVDAWPIVFTKVPETVVAHGSAVRLPGTAVSTQIDYEAELAIVIGTGGRNISKADAMQHVWGYTIVNDVTARDVQMRNGTWARVSTPSARWARWWSRPTHWTGRTRVCVAG